MSGSDDTPVRWNDGVTLTLTGYSSIRKQKRRLSLQEHALEILSKVVYERSSICFDFYAICS